MKRADEKLTRDFLASEFWCPCGMCDGGDIQGTFVERLQKLRDLVGHALIVSSGFRCPSHNSAIGGKKDSYHLVGRASDILCSNKEIVTWLALRAAAVGFNGLGLGQTFLHLDDRPILTTWKY